jgi:ABC-type proline/glycine betaine transport system substrate-binding protein
VAQVILEQKTGYTVNIMTADVSFAYTSVAEGDQDAFQWVNENPSVWQDWISHSRLLRVDF